MTKNFLDTYLNTYIKKINRWLLEFMPKRDKQAAVIYDGMRYSLMAGGKRIRAIFNLIGSEIGGIKRGTVKTFACGIEYIHTYSLVHDDLPMMDDDTMRRGQPSCHIAFGEAEAILIGNSLLTYGFYLLLKSMQGISEKNQLNAARYLLKTIGIYGMIGGQAEDINIDKNQIVMDEAKLVYIHRHKTGKFLTGALVSGALLGTEDESIINDLKVYSESFGLAFQITDDILDITADEITLGKNTGSDIDNCKLTYPAVYGLDKSKEMASEEIKKAKKIINKYGVLGKQLANLADYLIDRKY